VDEGLRGTPTDEAFTAGVVANDVAPKFLGCGAGSAKPGERSGDSCIEGLCARKAARLVRPATGEGCAKAKLGDEGMQKDGPDKAGEE
jgi:hypothetical protein